jgi:hypothetical protein
MSGISRRMFLKGSSAAVVAAGAISSMPGIPALVGAVEAQGPADAGTADAALSDAEVAGATSEPLVAHVRDLTTGEIGLFSGTREVTVVDRQLAASLVRALR